MGDEGREGWDRAWRGGPQRGLPGPPEVGVDGDLLRRFGEPTSVTVSEDPPEFADRVWRASERCPVCGRTTAGSARVAASLNLTGARGRCVGVGVWVHRACFEACPVVEGPAPVPW